MVALADLITPQVVEAEHLTVDPILKIVNCLELKVVAADMDIMVIHQDHKGKVALEVGLMVILLLLVGMQDMDKVFLEEMVQDILMQDQPVLVAVEVLEEKLNLQRHRLLEEMVVLEKHQI